MTQREDLLRRVRAANPLPAELELPDDVADSRPPLDLLINQERAGVLHKDPATGLRAKTRPWWAKPAVVFATASLLILGAIGIVVVSRGAQPDSAADAAAGTSVPGGTWNPILATSRAKPAPPAAACPPGTDPNAPGSIYQERPAAEGSIFNLAAAFDQHAGRIVYVDPDAETWTFDVCTNTWQRMNPSGALWSHLRGARLIYDVDSDLTVALGFEYISVYDANTNTWTSPANETIGFGDERFVPMGAAYDPVSGLILTTRQIWWGEPSAEAGFWELLAYDVDSNTWTLIGTIAHQPTEAERGGNDGQWLELMGYSATLDRLIFSSGNEETVLVDPRTGEAVAVATETPVVDLGWPGGVYGPAGDTVYVSTFVDDMCGFDTGAMAWSDCFDTPAVSFATIVGDPINQRLILINNISGGEVTAEDVWAVDLDTGAWTKLLGPSSQ